MYTSDIQRRYAKMVILDGLCHATIIKAEMEFEKEQMQALEIEVRIDEPDWYPVIFDVLKDGRDRDLERLEQLCKATQTMLIPDGLTLDQIDPAQFVGKKVYVRISLDYPHSMRSYIDAYWSSADRAWARPVNLV